MWLEIPDGNGGLVTSTPFTVTLTGAGYAETDWSHTLTSSDLSALPVGQHQVTAQIDPFGTAPFTQESTENDRSTTLFRFSRFQMSLLTRLQLQTALR